MLMAKVVGNVVATKKNETLIGYKLMVVKTIDSKLNFTGCEMVAADYVGAGVGEYVLLGKGSSVRVEDNRKNSCIDLAIIGIIDEVV